MSSRIEKGGARFKPSIVPRRPQSNTSSQPTTTSASQSSPASPPKPAAPSLPSTQATSNPSNRPIQPPTIGSNGITASQVSSTSSVAIPSSSKSFAFSPSPARIVVTPRATSVMNAASNSANTAATPIPTFRRPSVSRPSSGSRTSITPGSTGRVGRLPSFSTSTSVSSIADSPSSHPPPSSEVARKSVPISVASSRRSRGESVDLVSAQPTTTSEAPSSSSTKPKNPSKATKVSVGNPASRSQSQQADAESTTPPFTAVQPTGPSASNVDNVSETAEAQSDEQQEQHAQSQRQPLTAPIAAPLEEQEQPQGQEQEPTEAARVPPAIGSRFKQPQSKSDTASTSHRVAEIITQLSKQTPAVAEKPPRRGTRSRVQASAQQQNGVAELEEYTNIIGRDEEDDDEASLASDEYDHDEADPSAAEEEEEEEKEKDNDRTRSGSSTELRPRKERTQRPKDAAQVRARKKLKKKEEAMGKPRRPPSAYLLFINSIRSEQRAQHPDLSLVQLTAKIAAEWRLLTETEKTKWEQEATRSKQEYEQHLQQWNEAYPEGVQLGPSDESELETSNELDQDGQPIRKKKSKRNATRKKKTISDDEAEYLLQVQEQGPSLTASRIDPSTITMSELSSVNYKKGRAGPRTFELERVRRKQAEERKAAAAAAALLHGNDPDDLQQANAYPSASASAGPSSSFVEGEEEIVDEEDAQAADPLADSADAEAHRQRRTKRRDSSTGLTDDAFIENRFAVQTRIVDGKIVVDESSLFANYDNGEDDRDGMEIVDEREGDRFVNSRTHSKKFGKLKRWSEEDTAQFYKAVRQWGTDFEMIARLFPGRDRVMIKRKWNIEERAHPKLIDDALNNRLAIDLEEYALAAGVDLSGPPPEIKADFGDIQGLLGDGYSQDLSVQVKKREGTASEPEDNDEEYEEEIEIDENGNETVIRKRVGKKTATKKRKKSKTASSSSTTAAALGDTLSTAGTSSFATQSTSAAAGGSGWTEESRNSRPPAIGSSSQRSSSANRNASTVSGSGRRASRSETLDQMERERKHRADALRSQDGADMVETEEIVGEV